MYTRQANREDYPDGLLHLAFKPAGGNEAIPADRALPTISVVTRRHRYAETPSRYDRRSYQAWHDIRKWRL